MKRLPFIFLLLLVIAWPGAARPQVATAHSIKLTWTASTTSGVTYTVYRGTSAAGPFTVIASGLSVITFTDTTATDAVQYFYEVDAILSGEDSGPSNEVSATEPANPNPPSGLAAVAN
jgi:fibronectin type 3 domain-containing protein